MWPASHYLDVTNREVVIMTEMRTEMRIINALPFFYVLIMMFFLPRLIVMVVFVLVLGV